MSRTRTPTSDQPFEVEVRKPNLNCAGVVEARVAGEVCVEPLGQRRQALRALGAVVERGCRGDHDVQTGKSAGVDLVDQLAHRVQALLADVGAYSLERLDLVQNEHETSVT